MDQFEANQQADAADAYSREVDELRAAADRLAEACEGLVKAADHPFATDRDEQAREALTAYRKATASESAQAAGPTN